MTGECTASFVSGGREGEVLGLLPGGGMKQAAACVCKKYGPNERNDRGVDAENVAP
jgi:hypothetical protein